jgi:hypothetical protein
MGSFFKVIGKFAGFAAEKEAGKVLSEGVEAVRFIHTEEAGFKQIRMMRGEQKLGLLKYKEFGEGYTVMGIAGEAKGAGYQMRTELARVAKERGKNYLISDVFGSMSYDEVQAWTRLVEQGRAVKTEVPYAALGPRFAGRGGMKAAFMMPVTEATEVSTLKASRDLATAVGANKAVMKAGEGKSATSMSNRSLYGGNRTPRSL